MISHLKSPTKTTAADSLQHRPGDPANPVHELHKLLANSFQLIKDDQVDETTPAGSCLRPLLLALSWTGEDRHMVEALPHFDKVRNIEGLRAVLASLNFETEQRPLSTAEIKPSMVPCLFCHGDEVNVILKINDDGSLLTFNGALRDFVTVAPDKRPGVIYIAHETSIEDDRSTWEKTGWMQMVLGKFKRTFAVLLLLSLGINVLTMAVPLYIMNVYGMAIGAKSVTTLLALFVGIGLIVTIEVAMRNIRSRAIAYLGARVESLISIRAFQHLLYLPLTMTESAGISTQVTRLKQYEGVRELFTGSLIAAFLDLPFIGLFVLAIFAIGGVLGFVPIALIVLYVVLAAIAIPMANGHLRRAGGSKTKVRNFLMTTANKHQTLQETKAQETWIKRFETLSSQQLLNQFRAQHFNLTVQTIAQTLMMIAGATTIGIGTLLAMEDTISMGALIGATTLVWRGLSPIQSAFLGLMRLGQSMESVRQVNHLMLIGLERQPGKHATIFRKLKGKIALLGVSMRHSAQTEPALSGLNLRVNPGELIAITGNSGAGKSTLLKVIAGLYRPQAGVVQIDDIDSRQLDVGELRHELGFLPQRQSFFYGTISQNIRLAHPTATTEDIKKALKKAGVLNKVMELDGGLEFRLQGNRETRFSDGFLKQLMLARTFVKEAPIYLLDEPGAQLDNAADEKLMETLLAEKGKSTILMVTHRPSHMRLADRVVVLNYGQIVADGPPEKIVPMILAQGNKVPGKQSAG